GADHRITDWVNARHDRSEPAALRWAAGGVAVPPGVQRPESVVIQCFRRRISVESDGRTETQSRFHYGHTPPVVLRLAARCWCRPASIPHYPARPVSPAYSAGWIYRNRTAPSPTGIRRR